MKKQYKVIHVELKEPYKGRKHHYFGSKSAVYEYLTDEVVGIGLSSLWNVDLSTGEYTNSKVTIREGRLLRKRTNRGKTNT